MPLLPEQRSCQPRHEGLATAAIELFRNGDIGVTTNGVAALLPRVLPFPHDGFGQDDEWVSANFTNATEILAVGYQAEFSSFEANVPC